MRSVMVEIAEWADGLPYWEQAALDKIVAGKAFKEEDYQELLQYLLEDAQLATREGKRPRLKIQERLTLPSNLTKPLKLQKITNLQNINALVQNQTLTFGPALTAIFGANGSGKSGYARVFGSAGFTRGDRDVLPDITKPIPENQVLCADIQLLDDTTERIIHYQVGVPCQDLASFYIFDSTSVHVHMCEQNPLSFSPAGLSFLRTLACVTDEVRVRLDALVEKRSELPVFSSLYQGESEVSALLENLGPDTDISLVTQLGSLTGEEKKRLHELNIEIANAELDEFRAKISSLRQKIGSLRDFLARIFEARNRLDDQKMASLNQDNTVFIQRLVTAHQVSIDLFKTGGFTQIGSDIWHQFIVAAKTLADDESAPGQPYPKSDSQCLLCQQPLSDNALALIRRLWDYLQSDEQNKLDESQSTLTENLAIINTLSLFDLAVDFSTAYQYIQDHDAGLHLKVISLVAAYRARRDAAQLAIESKSSLSVTSLPENCEEEIEQYIASLEKELSNLESTSLDVRVKELEDEKRLLDHRIVLSNILSKVIEYIRMRNWARDAEKAGGTTRHITQKHNELFEELVTGRYIELFGETLKALGRPIKVRVRTIGKKGETLKQIILESDRSASELAKPEKVLSEGEKRAVALADFLTEVTLDDSSSGIILDDPVTSLDLDWRVTIAKMLVDQAKQRQVIIFTHDLPFLYYIKKFAEQNKIEIETHWIKRSEDDDKPGYVHLNNSPALEREYRKPIHARELYARAKNAAAAEQEFLLKEGFAALRTSYEAFIVFDLFNEVVMRFDERISFGRLKEVVWDASLANDVIRKCEELSRFIEGHLHSDAMGAIKPGPQDLFDEIEFFESLRIKLDGIRKSAKITA